MSYAARVSSSVCRSLSLVAMLGGAFSISAANLFAAENVAQQATPELLVRQALESELKGGSDRQQLLQQAQQLDPDYAPARWHSAQLKYNEKWTAAANIPDLAKSDATINEYLKVRDKYPQTAAGQFDLANWCAKKGLPAAERAHLETVIQLNPDHAAARARLGYHRLNGDWLTDEDWRLEQGRAKALKEWTPKINEIRQGLAQSNETRHAEAAAKLKAINDPAAIPVLEDLAFGDDDEIGAMAVAALGNIQGPQGSLALARVATFCDAQPVQADAIDQLRKRPLEEFVPPMVSALSSPITAQSEICRAGRTTFYRQTFSREAQDANEVIIQESQVRTKSISRQQVGLPKGGRPVFVGINVSPDVIQTRQQLQEQNAAIKDLNDRVILVLATLTDRPMTSEPQDWWAWWQGYSELYPKQEKPTNVTYEQTAPSETVVIGLVSCFAAGTKVPTLLGPMPIEKIKIGDQVLSQDPDTGELAYKPVLLTTIRPATQLFALDIDGEKIQATGGHLFWVAGLGWMKARQLKPSYELHTTSGTVQLSGVAEGSSEPAYNLVVADFHTYFVGDHQVLSHDNTLRQPTKAIVPGLAAR